MIATSSSRSYLRTMTAARLVRLLTIFAMLLAPLGMIGGHAAMATPIASGSMAEHHVQPADHHAAGSNEAEPCDDMGGQSEDERSSGDDCLVDCAITCSAIPAAGAMMAQPATFLVAQPHSLVAVITGRHPESDPPPPRVA